ncbi:MAG: sensor domain-containing diguanylate cyclase [Calditrichaceae bacterium]|nr:sensor domain-containing diguanylate cyclase [Calditrichaceae bacterium]MBN2709672.1 sensor domain-containing diguanylate cyclase [Calditrichaceae bacterium]RQV95030.1 MAG: sensor domain-containing diguanylate cyclase [Calditrichota bacterium]
METQVKKSLINCMSDLLPVLDDMNRIKSSERTLHNIVNMLTTDLNCKTCAVIQINPDTDLLEIRNSKNLSWMFCKNFHRRIEGPMLLELILKGREVYIPDKKFASSYALEFQLENDFVSSYCLQLIANQKPLGLLYVDSDKVDAFPPESRLMLQLYAKLISMVLFVESITKRLEKLDASDEETGALRFEHFYPKLSDMFERSKRLEEKMTVILVDVEKYAKIVKIHGINAAIEILKDMVSLIQRSLRKYDGICRYGADEFLIALPGTSVEQASKAAGKIYKLMENKKYTKNDLVINTYAGMANYPDNADTLDGLLTAVRTALFVAKRRGSINKVTVIPDKFE